MRTTTFSGLEAHLHAWCGAWLPWPAWGRIWQLSKLCWKQFSTWSKLCSSSFLQRCKLDYIHGSSGLLCIRYSLRSRNALSPQAYELQVAVFWNAMYINKGWCMLSCCFAQLDVVIWQNNLWLFREKAHNTNRRKNRCDEQPPLPVIMWQHQARWHACAELQALTVARHWHSQSGPQKADRAVHMLRAMTTKVSQLQRKSYLALSYTLLCTVHDAEEVSCCGCC